MRDLNDKITNSLLTADEWNDVPSELQNVIEQTDQTLSAGDLNQVGKGIADYVANSNFYTDSGVADAYVLTSIGSKQSPTAYTDGMAIEFLPGNTNTGASTVNVATLGVKTITGATAGNIVSGFRIVLKFRSGADDFVIDGGGDVVEEVNNVITGTGQTPDDVDQNQLGKGIATYAANGDFYTDSGAADVYVLAVIGSKQGPVDYVDGMQVRFIADNTNTLATATINVAGLGVKNIVSLTAGDLSTTTQNTIVFRTGSGDFELTTVGVAPASIGIDEIDTSELGPVVQIVEGISATFQDISTTIPIDDTSPQQTEGDEIVTATITPKKSTNAVLIQAVGQFGGAGTIDYTIAIFRDAIATSLEASGGHVIGTAQITENSLYFLITNIGSVAATTIKLRAGPSGATNLKVNGNNTGRIYGGEARTKLLLWEFLKP